MHLLGFSGNARISQVNQGICVFTESFRKYKYFLVSQIPCNIYTTVDYVYQVPILKSIHIIVIVLLKHLNFQRSKQFRSFRITVLNNNLF